MIALVDYGAGNLRSVANALDLLGFPYRLARVASDLAGASRILLPGVGHFGPMMEALDRQGLRGPLRDSGLPLLGICLGMQALYEASEEAPGAVGLGLMPGTVERLPETLRVPHMGWNQVRSADGASDWFYFAHSFYARPDDSTLGVADYGVRIAASVRRGRVAGFQFHPEKSARAGLRLLRDWCANGG